MEQWLIGRGVDCESEGHGFYSQLKHFFSLTIS